MRKVGDLENVQEQRGGSAGGGDERGGSGELLYRAVAAVFALCLLATVL